MSQIDNILFYEEGYREFPYNDSEMYPTVGIGKKLGPKYTPLDVYQISMPLDVAKLWVKEDCKTLSYDIQNDTRTASAWDKCNEARQDILTAMAYQLGFEGLCDFKNMIAAINEEDYETAHDEMLDSLWHNQTPERCEREADVMLHGSYKPYEGLFEA